MILWSLYSKVPSECSAAGVTCPWEQVYDIRHSAFHPAPVSDIANQSQHDSHPALSPPQLSAPGSCCLPVSLDP